MTAIRRPLPHLYRLTKAPAACTNTRTPAAPATSATTNSPSPPSPPTGSGVIWLWLWLLMLDESTTHLFLNVTGVVFATQGGAIKVGDEARREVLAGHSICVLLVLLL